MELMGRVDSGPRTPLVGRSADLAELDERFDATLNGNAQVVVLAGEAGIGKSRLLADFLLRRDDCLAAVGHCLELGPDGPPFAPFVMLLRTLVAELGAPRVAELAGPGAADLAVLLPELGAAAGSDPLGRGRLFEAMASLLEHAAEEQPLVMAVEDLHWSDSSTRDLVAFLVRTVTASRVLFVLTYRSDELPRSSPLLRWLTELDRLPAAHRVVLDRLHDADVDELVRILAGPVPPRTGARIREHSEGIPFFVEELTSCGTELPTIPDSLRDLMLARLDGLADPTRAIVRMASAANTQVDHAVLRTMAGMAEPELDAALREAVNGRVLVVDAGQRGYSFRHALMREAVHADLLPGEHARLHARYAEALERDASPDRAGEIAHHWISAHEAAKSFEWSLRAADHSRSVYAWQEELNHLNRALDLWDQVERADERAGFDRVELLARAGRAAGNSGRSEQAVAYYDAAMGEVDGAARPQRLAHLLVQRAAQCSLPRDTLPDLSRALELAAPGSADRAAALCQTAAHYLLAGRLEAAVLLAADAIEAAEQAEALDLQGHGHNTLGCAQLHTGRADEGFGHLERARELAVAAGDWPGLLRYFGNLSDDLIGMGRFAEAIRVAAEGRAVATERGWNRTMGAFLGGNEAEAMVQAGRWDEALVTIDDVLRLDPPPITRAHVHVMRAVIRLRRADTAGCCDDIETAVERLGYGITQPQYQLPISATQAWLDVEAGQPQQALVRLRDAAAVGKLAMPTSAGWPFVVAWARLVGAVLQSDRASELVADLAAAQLGAREIGAHLAAITGHEGLQAFVTAQLRENDAALAGAGADSATGTRKAPEDSAELAARWGSAVTALTASDGLTFELAHARIRLAEHLLALSRRPEAREHLTAAWQAIDELRCESLRASASRVAAAARLQLRPTRRGTDLLTDREREVLDLVAAGRSNRAISEELFISVKTTSVHVSHILAKIGASSRTEAAAWAHEHGVGPAVRIEGTAAR